MFTLSRSRSCCGTAACTRCTLHSLRPAAHRTPHSRTAHHSGTSTSAPAHEHTAQSHFWSQQRRISFIRVTRVDCAFGPLLLRDARLDVLSPARELLPREGHIPCHRRRGAVTSANLPNRGIRQPAVPRQRGVKTGAIVLRRVTAHRSWRFGRPAPVLSARLHPPAGAHSPIGREER